MTTKIRTAQPADAARLSRFARKTFRETFEADNGVEDIARYLDTTFTPERQAAEIGAESSIVLLAEQDQASEARLVGYAFLVLGAVSRPVHGPAPAELRRIYVARPWQGQGVARALMEAALDAARERGARTIWLGVWERNPRAVAFYRKHGFERVGEHTFMLGSDAQTDWVFARSLD